jgi:preprotein translocase subunit YajC
MPLTSHLIVLAQLGPNPSSTAPVSAAPVAGGVTAVPGTPAIAATQKEQPGLLGNLPNVLLFAVPLILVYMLLFRGKGKEEKKRKAMIEQLKRGDEVMTIGGLIGTVVDVRGERVIIKVDESNNVKETYLKSAIQKVVEASDLKP